MGLCLSKKGLQEEEKISSASSPKLAADALPPQKVTTPPRVKEEKPAAEVKKQTPVANRTKEVQESKKEEKTEEPKRFQIVFPKEEPCRALAPAAVRTSSCTKEEVDAILIQCGRLSRSSSGKGSSENNGRGTSSGGGSRKYAGSKRSFDFDHDSAEKSYDDEEKPQIRPAHRRTPSRERDGGGASELKRSSSRDEGRRSGSRRASRSPGRRQETPTEKSRPGKMVSVPATVSTGREAGNGVRKVSAASAKRGEVGVRSSASPRARSPAKTKAAPASNENIHHHSQPSISRNSSRKAEQSPCRRNPMSEIDDNILKTEQPTTMKNQDLNKSSKGNIKKMARSREGEEGTNKGPHLQQQKSNENAAAQTPKPNERNIKTVEIPHGTSSNGSRGIREQLMSCRAIEQQQEREMVEAAKGSTKSSDIAAASQGTENFVPQTITRSRSSRRSRDLDLDMGLNPETLLNPSYASILLEDIQNYHSQNPAFTLPPCVSKARSILEAVADLNSSTSSNLLSPAFSEEKSSELSRPNHYNNSTSFDGNSHSKLMGKGPFVESEVVANKDDLMEPSLHKYVTVREPLWDMEQQESAGSNSFLGNHWSSSWEPNSADSTDRWTSSLSNTGEEVEQQHLGSVEAGRDFEAGARRLRRRASDSNSMLPATSTLRGKKRESDGVNGKVGLASFTLPPVAAAAAAGR